VFSTTGVVEEYRTVVGRELDQVLEMAVESDREEMARNKLGCDTKTSHVISSASETMINP
jgi:hypothetical protein